MNQPAPHPITLEQVIFTRSVVIAVPTHTPNSAVIKKGPENSISVLKIEGEPRAYSATMRTVMNQEADAAYPYTIDMECVAILHADETLSDDEAHRGVFITANSVLYGAIRESVAWLTGRQPYGPLLLGLSVLQSAPAPQEVAAPH